VRDQFSTYLIHDLHARESLENPGRFLGLDQVLDGKTTGFSRAAVGDAQLTFHPAPSCLPGNLSQPDIPSVLLGLDSMHAGGDPVSPGGHLNG